jgi:hypothetical protein
MRDEQQIRENAIRQVDEEIAASHGAPSWWYLSYADDNGFRGGAYLRAFGPASAALRAAIEGISPGGQVRIVGPLPLDDPNAPMPPPEDRERLLTFDELQRIAPMVRWDTGEDA